MKEKSKIHESLESEVGNSTKARSSNNTKKRALREWFGIGREQYESLQQTIMSMGAEIDILIDQPKSPDVSAQLEILHQLKDALREISSQPEMENNWQHLNGIEKRLVSLYPTERVSAELHRRLSEAGREQAGFVDFYRGQATIIDDDDDESIKKSVRERYVLQMLLTDLHWFYNKRFLKRLHSQYAINKASFVFFLSFSVFVLVLTFLSSTDQSSRIESTSNSSNTLNVKQVNLKEVE